MPKLPQVSARDLVRAFERMGFERVSQRGSHIKMQDDKGCTVVIPNHGGKSIKPGTQEGRAQFTEHFRRDTYTKFALD